ncbi:oleate hydratase [Streptomyces sp. H39-S7]|uniref:oleate hydratase n=1 Tax=Streptomyces sp. H39-S7 TaxID=3004357 RepID=UPI0022AF39DC|nr:oleate hydratase [Streptomyces sp. H39-S7]MCZ4122752.1 oleate hydratase [Streptomyces sp. H39-S7]
MAKAYLVGSGIAALSAAAFLIRDGGFAGRDIHVFEEQEQTGGSLDAAGTAEAGYTMRGGRMFEAQFRCTYDLLSTIPSLDDPSKSVTQDTFDCHDAFPWDDVSRLVDADRKIVDVRSMGFRERDRLDLVKCLATPERLLDRKRISDCFSEGFFTTNFWFMWCTTFAFEPWHSAIEFRRYLNRFVHLFPEFDTMSGIFRTRYNQYDSIVRPLQTWLADQGVTVHTGHRVTDLTFAQGEGTTVERILYTRDGHRERREVGPEDLVFVTNGSMTANSSLGSDTAAPVPDTSGSSGAWRLWQWLARGREDFGNPHVFDRSVKDSTWESFTVTCKDPLFAELMEALGGREAGRGGLMTFPASNWLLTIVLNHQPVYADQPADITVWWGYGLFPDRAGNHIGKPMTDCTGQEILREVLHHLKFDENAERIAAASTVIPCLMPYITSQFLVREHGDRPQVVPKGSTNLAFIGQFAEVPDDVVFTVEYSVRTAWTAVAQLLHLDKAPPPVYKGAHDPRVLVRALETMHRA